MRVSFMRTHMKLKSSFLLALSITPSLTLAALGPIVITPSSYEQPIQEVITPITIITEQNIKNSAASNVSELLRGQAGLNVRDLFGDGNQATIDLRGFGPNASNSTLILVNGRRLNNSTDSGAPDLSTINLDEIKQIEILQGSAGVLYGNQAIGGVINIIMKEVIQNSTTMTGRIGSHNARSLGVQLNRVFGKTSLILNAKTTQSDNYRDYNDTDKKHFSLRVNRIHDTFTTFVELIKTDDHLKTPGALLQSELNIDRQQSANFYANDYFDTQTNIVRIGLLKSINSNQSFKFDISQRTNDREFLQSFRPTAATTVTTQDRTTKSFNALYTVSVPENSLSPLILFGLNHENNQYKLVSSFGPQPITQKIMGFYVSTDLHINDESTINFGLRSSHQDADNNSNNLDDDQTVYSATYSWHKNDVKAYVRADQNFRFPTVEEHTGTGFGNPVGLKTQTGTSFEIGTELAINNNKYRATLYQINLKNEIAYDGSLFANFNLDDTTRNGFIIEANNMWNSNFSSQISLTMIDAKTSNGPYKNKALPLVPESVLRIAGTFKINHQMLSNIEFLNVDDQVLGGDFDNALEKLKSYQVINANINYTQRDWNVSFRINNLLNETYSETGNQFTDYSNFPTATNKSSFFTAPERNFWLTTQYKF